MTLDRRAFVRLGSLGTAGVLGSWCGGGSPAQKAAPPTALKIRIRGLCIVERLANAVNVRLIDSTKLTTIMLPVHTPLLSVPTADIDSATAASVSDPEDAGRTAFNLTGLVSLDSGNHGAADLNLDDSPVSDQLPPNDDSWKSVNLGARLSTICGSTHVTADPSKFVAQVQLDHGHLRALKPTGDVGPVTIWTFTRTVSGATQQVAKQPMTNILLCTVNVPGVKPTFTIAGKTVVLKTGATDVMVKNLPAPNVKGHCAGSIPCVDHMAAYYELVDKQFDPTVIGVAQSLISPSADPDYCPPAT